MRSRSLLALASVALLALLAACGGDDGDDDGRRPGQRERATTTTAAAGDGACAGDVTDLLAEICEKGVLTVSTDPAYPPQSSLERADRRVRRLRHRRRHRDRQAAGRRRRLGGAVVGRHHRGQLERPLGHHRRLDDADQRPPRGPLLHRALQLHAGRGRGRGRQRGRSPTSAPTSTARRSASAAAAPTTSSSTRTLAIEGYEFDFIIDDAEVSGYDTDTTALQDLANGRLDAVITSVTTAQGYIDAGNPVKIVGDPVFYEPLSVGFDKSADPSSESLYEAVDAIVAEMHEDGTLTGLLGGVVRPGPHHPGVSQPEASSRVTPGSGSSSRRRGCRSG